MSEQEFKNYNDLGNWNFSDIKYTVFQESSWNFYNEVSKHSTKESLILDLGTGGGEKCLQNMPEAGMIIATDFSPEMIRTAKLNLLNYPNKKIKFAIMDNLKMTFPSNVFDIVTARHTPIDATQIYNCLDDNGILIVEGIDKYDCWELKTLFGRGQSFNDKISISKIDYDNIKKAGFKKVNFQEIVQYEYYETANDLLALLAKTPIINDFTDMRKIEKDLFDTYITNYISEKGIELKRVLYGIVAQK